MAKKKDNTLLWVGALAIGGYLLYKNSQATATAAPSTSATATSPLLSIPQNKALTSPAPVSLLPASPAPNPTAVATTNLVPATVNANNVPVLSPGQTIAVNANGSPVTNNAGTPLVFTSVPPLQPAVQIPISLASPSSDMTLTATQEKAYQMAQMMSGYQDEGECL